MHRGGGPTDGRNRFREDKAPGLKKAGEALKGTWVPGTGRVPGSWRALAGNGLPLRSEVEATVAEVPSSPHPYKATDPADTAYCSRWKPGSQELPSVVAAVGPE